MLALGCGDTTRNAGDTPDTPTNTGSSQGTGGATLESDATGATTTLALTDPTGGTGGSGSDSFEVAGDSSGCGNSSHSASPDASCAAVLCPLLPFSEAYPDATEPDLCRFALVAPPGGEVINPKTVNVLVEFADGTVEPLRYTDDPNSCAASAWYYDDPDEPLSILLCPGLCERIEQSSDAKLQVGYGCVTQPL